jgi:hypothetical protein
LLCLELFLACIIKWFFTTFVQPGNPRINVIKQKVCDFMSCRRCRFACLVASGWGKVWVKYPDANVRQIVIPVCQLCYPGNIKNITEIELKLYTCFFIYFSHWYLVFPSVKHFQRLLFRGKQKGGTHVLSTTLPRLI